MKQQKYFVGLMFLVLLSSLIGCATQSPVVPNVRASELLMDVSAFPSGWIIEPCDPQCAKSEGTYQAVRSFYVPHKANSVVDNVYWYETMEEAQDSYLWYREHQFVPASKPNDTDFIIPTRTFTSTIADESYLACAMRIGAECCYLARYDQYLVFSIFHMDEQQLYGSGLSNSGLTLEQLDTILTAYDELIKQKLDK